MKHLISIILLLCYSIHISSAQTSSSHKVNIQEEMNSLFKKNNLHENIVIDKERKIIYSTVSENNIPYQQVSINYHYESFDIVSGKPAHLVDIKCDEGNCITFTDPRTMEMNGTSLPFKTKEDAYKFIDLLFKLKKETK